MTALLAIEGLRAFYGASEALHGLDMTLDAGTITAVLGANGAGKSTTLRAISGLVRRQGRIAFEGRSIERLGTEDIARLGIAHVPEGRGTFVELTVDENLRLGGLVRRDRVVARSDLDRMLDYFPRLRERFRQQAGTLSGGEQQMLAIARALMLRPRLILLDEPSFGLAPLIIQEIFRILKRINTEDGVTILVVEQNARLALGIADHAYLLETGRVVLSGPAGDVGADEEVQRAYLGVTAGVVGAASSPPPAS